MEMNSPSVEAKGASTIEEDSDKETNLKHLGRFILKISDMGLSKQLDAGEASFTSMSMNVSRLGGGGSRGASSSGGANSVKDPVGTIGWQAPELMAARNGVELDRVEDDGEEGKEDNTEEGEDTEIDASTATSAASSTTITTTTTTTIISHPTGALKKDQRRRWTCSR